VRAFATSSLLLVACAGSPASSSSPPASAPCLTEAEIQANVNESTRLSDAAHEARQEAQDARRELEVATDEAARAVARETIDAKDEESGVYFAQADVHYFEAQRLREECERPKPDSGSRRRH
jgi:hypothetical protein